MQNKGFHRYIHYIPIIGLALLVIIAVYARSQGIFDSVDTLRQFIKHFGDAAVLIFVLIQVITPIIPILPGGIAVVVGMLMFGNFPGMLYSYLGLVAGEILLFLLVQRYGKSFARFILSEKNYEKFEAMLARHTNGIRNLLVASFILPFLPDDIVCLVAGMSKMSLRQYTLIVLLLKPWSIATYGYLMIYFVDKASHLMLPFL